MMKRIVSNSLWALFLLLLMVYPRFAGAQDTQKSAAESTAKEDAKANSAPEGPPVRVKIVFSEYDGDKKVKSLPYTMLVREPRGESSWSKIRMGSRVPVASGGEKGSYQFQYIDVGTNIDCKATRGQDGRYRLFLMMERSWVEGEASIGDAKSYPAGAAAPVGVFQPIIRQFRSDSEVLIRDGQTLETNFATDPVSGKVIRLEVSLEVTK